MFLTFELERQYLFLCNANTTLTSLTLARKVSSFIKNDPALYSRHCSGHLSLGALFAQLYQSGLLNRYGAMFISSEMRHIFGLGRENPISSVYDIKAATYKRELACQEIILAGERLSRETKNLGPHKVTKEQGKTWTTGFEKLVQSTDEDLIGYKKHARDAHSKIFCPSA